MFDIEGMIKSNDFSKLIHSTQEERDRHGGNQVIYSQLSNYLFFGFIQKVIREVFKDDDAILKHLEEQLSAQTVFVSKNKNSPLSSLGGLIEESDF